MTTAALALIFASASTAYDLPPGLLSALCWVESRHRVAAINPHDRGGSSLGVCQIKLKTAESLGYVGSKQLLMQPDINIYWAAAYLKHQVNRYHGDLRKGIAAYNGGKWRENSRGLTKNRKYVGKVFKAWSEDK